MLLGVLFCESQTNRTRHAMYFDTRKDNGSCRIVEENPECMPQSVTCIQWEVGSEKAGKKEKERVLVSKLMKTKLTTTQIKVHQVSIWLLPITPPPPSTTSGNVDYCHLTIEQLREGLKRRNA